MCVAPFFPHILLHFVDIVLGDLVYIFNSPINIRFIGTQSNTNVHDKAYVKVRFDKCRYIYQFMTDITTNMNRKFAKKIVSINNLGKY